MTKYRESKAPVTTSTYDRSEIEKGVDNIYEAISIISKRSTQITSILGRNYLKNLTNLQLQ